MAKQYAYAIKRDDGKYWNCAGRERNFEDYWTDIFHARIFTEELIKMQPIEELIEFRQLENCKPVKICIEECEE